MSEQKKTTTASASTDELKELQKSVLALQLQLEQQARASKGLEVKPQDGSTERFYSGKGAVNHDLFKLEVEPMMRNVSWDVKDPDYRPVEHCHMFHTVDSSGKQQTYSTTIGGHFHLMEVTEQDGAPVVKCASGPLEWRMIKRGNRSFRKAVPVFNGKFLDWDKDEPKIPVDGHVHKTEYLRSEKILLRKVNAEATKLIADNANLTVKPSDLDLA